MVKTLTSSPSSNSNCCTVAITERRTNPLGKGLVQLSPQHGRREGKRQFQLQSTHCSFPKGKFVTYLCTVTNQGSELFYVAVFILEISSLQSPFKAAPETTWECLEHLLSAAHTTACPGEPHTGCRGLGRSAAVEVRACPGLTTPGPNQALQQGHTLTCKRNVMYKNYSPPKEISHATTYVLLYPLGA